MIIQEKIQKIQKKAEGFGKLAPVFLEGAKFALKNQWISVEDDLPCNHEELIDIDTRSIHQKTLFVIVWNGKFIDIDFMFYKKGKWEWVCNNSNTHWFPMPKPPKE